jgi:tape measure domain-containing protein
MANVIDILVSKQAQAELDKVIASLKVTHEEIIKINQQGLKINSGASAKNPIDLNATIKQNEELNKKYAEQNEKLKLLNAQKQKAQVRTSEEIVNQRALAQASDRQARATSALVGAMANLNAKHQQAKLTLQNLIASQTASNAQIRQAQKEYDLLDKRVVKANNAVRQFNYNVGNYPKQAISGIRNLVGAFGIVGGVSMFAMIAKDIFQTTKELQSLDNALKQVSGTQEAYSNNQAFLKETSEAFGLEIKGLTTQFTQFYVSAKDKISGKEIENIFTSVAKAGSIMGLSVDNQNRAFLALNQMMSKGVVSAEELRGQLGEALPGAFGIMAKALNVNEQQLGKLMKDGKLLASEVLPKFAEALEKVYGIETIERVETLSASQNRLSKDRTSVV